MSSILDLREKLDNGSVTSEELFNSSVDMANKYQDEYNSFVTIMDNYEKVDSNSILSGIPFRYREV